MVVIRMLVINTELDNFKFSTILRIMNCIEAQGLRLLLHVLFFKHEMLSNNTIIKSLEDFKFVSVDSIVNCYNKELVDMKENIRYLYGED